MKVFSFLLLITVFFVLAFQSTKKEDKIYWTVERKLTWDDFRGIAKKNNTAGAISSVGLNYKLEVQNNNIHIDIVATFDKKKSWVNEDDKIPSTLKHEQGHFDIAEIYARKFRKKLHETKKIKQKNCEEKIKTIYSQINEELHLYQKLYDKETTNPRNESKQIEWNEKIEKELNEWKNFSDTKIIK